MRLGWQFLVGLVLLCLIACAAYGRSATSLWSFGCGWFGALGHGDYEHRCFPERVQGLSGSVRFVAAGAVHSLVVLESGDVYAFGYNSAGQLGVGDTADRPTPTRVLLPGPAVAVAAGAEHSLFLLANGHVYASGSNSRGQLGRCGGDTAVPVRVEGISGAVAVAAGQLHSLVVLNDGSVMAFGANWRGQLGLGDTEDRCVPTRVATISNARAVAAGYHHSAVLLADGSVMVFGHPYSKTPVRVSGVSNVKSIACGLADEVFFVLGNGEVWAVGGQLEATDCVVVGWSTPRNLPGISNAVAVAHTSKTFLGHIEHGLVITASGDVLGFGESFLGSLGLGCDSPPVCRGPTLISGLRKVVAAACGWQFSLLVIEEDDEPGLTEIRLGKLVIRGDAIQTLGGGKYRVSGNTNINGFLWIDGELLVDTQRKSATGNCKVRFSPQSSSAGNLWLSNATARFVIDASRDPPEFRFDGTVPAAGFKIAGCEVRLTNIRFFFDSASWGSGLHVGTVRVSVANILDELTLTDLRMSTKQGVRFERANMVVTDKALPGGFKLKTLNLTYIPGPDFWDPGQATFRASGEVVIPQWNGAFSGELEVLSGRLNTIGVHAQFASPGVLILPQLLLYLQEIGGTLTGLATNSPEIRDGVLRLTAGPEVVFGGQRLRALSMRIHDGRIGNGWFSAKGTITVIWEGGNIASGSVEWNAKAGLTLVGYFVLGDCGDGDGIISGSVKARIGTDAVIRADALLAVKLPQFVPIVGGSMLAEVLVKWRDVTFGFSVTVGWVEFGIIITADADCKACRNCLVGVGIPATPLSIHVGCNLDLLGAVSVSSRDFLSGYHLRPSAVREFQVPHGRPYAMFVVTGPPGSTPEFAVLGPGGLVVTPDVAKSDPERFAYRENVDIGEAWIAVRNPSAGTWSVEILESPASGLATPGELLFEVKALAAVNEPSIEVMEPAVDTTTTTTATIQWNGWTEVMGAAVSLYRTTDPEVPGDLIAEGLAISGTYEWDVRGTAPGTYYIYAEIDDGRNLPVRAIAPGTVTVTKASPEAVVAVESTAEVGSLITLDGSHSTDPWDSPLTFDWAVISRPEGSISDLITNGAGQVATIIPDSPGIYEIELRVSDPYGLSSSARVTVSVVSRPAVLDVRTKSLTVPVGATAIVIAALLDKVGAPFVGAELRFAVVWGPGAGATGIDLTGIAGTAAFAYSSPRAGTDTVRIWYGASTYESAAPNLRGQCTVTWVVSHDPTSPGKAWSFEEYASQAEAQAAGWVFTGLWRLTGPSCAECMFLGGNVVYFGNHETCTYEVLDRRGRSVRSQGTLTSPVIAISPNTALTLEFDFFREVENYRRSTLDRAYVQIRLGRESRGRITWSGWRTVWSRSSKDPSPECGTGSYTFSTRNYTRLQIRFIFDSVNGNNNRFRGWAVDNVVLKPAAGASLTRLGVADLGEGWDLNDEGDREELKVLNTPNPIRDVRTTTFTVLGVEGEALRVEVYDLAGRLVWKGETEGNELPWHTEDLTGLPLANGVYLYLAYVKVDGEWIRLGPQKLVILR